MAIAALQGDTPRSIAPSPSPKVGPLDDDSNESAEDSAAEDETSSDP